MSGLKPFRRIKIGDVAEALGLSVSTVSRALNGYADVNEDTRSRIEETAKRLGYQPSSIGVRLRKGRGHAAGFVMPPTRYEFADPIFLPVLAGIDERLREAGIQLVITTTSEEDQLPSLKRMIESGQVDSMILARMRRNDPRVEYLQSLGVPMSLLGQSLSHPQIASVEGDHSEALRLSIERLAGLGRRRIAHINAPLHYNYGLDRDRAFRHWMEACGLPLADAVAVEADLSERGGHAATVALLERKVRPDAIIAVNDATAVGAMHALVQAGLTPGADIALIGCDDISVAALVNPPLTTLRFDYHAMGVRVAEHLLLRLEGRQEPMRHVAPPTLVVRAT